MAREMKDSGVEWIGQIPNNWKINKLNRIFETITDYVASGSFADLAKNVTYLDLPNYARLIRTADVSGKRDSIQPVYINEHSYNFLKNSNLFGGELILPNIGAIGDVYLVPKLYEKMSLAPNLIMLRTSQNILYYYYLFLSSLGKKMLLNLSQSTAQPKFNKTQLRQLKVLEPTIKEQEKIANYLDKKVTDIDLIIEKTKATIEDYKKYKQSIITEAVTKGLNPNVEMKDSRIEWIGQIPKHWKIRKIKSFLSIISKGTTPKEISSNKSEKYKIKYIKSENISNGLVINIPEFYITSEVNEELKRSQLQEDILFVIAGAGIGKTAIMPLTLLPANTNQAVSFLRLQERYQGYKRYLWYFLQSNILKIYIELFSVQSAQPNLSMENLSNLKISLPEIFEIDNIVAYLDKKVSEIDNLIAKKESLINEMEEYKKSLIYECVTGKKEII